MTVMQAHVTTQNRVVQHTGSVSLVRRTPERSPIATPAMIGRAALIIDGGWGIGRAVAIDFAQRGASIAFSGWRDTDDRDSTRAVLESFGAQTLAIPHPASDETDCRRIIAEVHDRFGRIDVLVHASAIAGDAPLHKMHGDRWDEILHVHLGSAYQLARAVINPMRQRGYGRIVFVTDPVTAETLTHYPRPRVGQSGIIGLAQTLARENAARCVTVNCVCPGVIASPKDAGDRMPKSDHIAARIPMQRIGRPEEVAHLVSYLASEQAEYITGQVVHIDGGLSA